MPFLKNCWYAAGWASELGAEPIARTFLDVPVVLFRDEHDQPAALRDACPHRFAPLSLGRLKDGAIVCGYHGLEFARDGRCVRNPHGKAAIPVALNVQSFPLAEKQGMLWIWMGVQEQADTDLLPNLAQLEDPTFTWVYDKLKVSANYELVIDNLLDLSHVEFLHPFLASPGNSERTQFRTEQRDGTIISHYLAGDEPISLLFQLLWDRSETVADLSAVIQWSAPSNLQLDTALGVRGTPPEACLRIPTVHLLSPESSESTHYFWAAGRNRRIEDLQLSEMIRSGTANAFENEDEPMIRAVRSRMRSSDLFAHKPALLAIDESAVRARRLLAKLIEAESNELLHSAA